MESLVRCEGLVKIYKVADLEQVALQGLDLEVREGEMIGIVGPSGSGKSTLLNILGGLDTPSAGKVVVGGRDLLKLSASALDTYRRHEVGFLWQQPSRNLIPYLSLLDNVRLPMMMTGVGARLRDRRARELLERMGLWGHRERRPAALSGGQQQRAALAVALANGPRLLLADEPTGELDSATAEEIYDLLHRLNEETHLTVLIVTHDPDIAGHVSRVVAIRDGKISSEVVTADRSGSSPARGSDASRRSAEYVVLDGAGRLQIPAHYLKRFRIGRRAVLEPREDGILVRPPQEDPHE